jgi:hypothetical protein
MPLSEHEQKILSEMEASLTSHDPRFAKSVATTNVFAIGRRRVRLSILGFIAGLVLLVATFASSIILGLLGVLLMFASALVAERNLRLMGRATLHDFLSSRGGDDTPPVEGDRMRRMRDAFQRLRRR